MQVPQSNDTGKKRDRSDPRLSKDGLWRSFPKVPNLLQYVNTGTYYARVKKNGKVIRRSLETDVWSTARLRRLDFLKDQGQDEPAVVSLPFTEALTLYRQNLKNDTTIKPQSKQYREWCIRRIELSWPELWKLSLDAITVEVCNEWGAKLNREISCHYYNNTIGTLRQILACGIAEHERRGGAPLQNPARQLSKTRVTQKELKLPEPDQFRRMVEIVAKGSGGWGPREADTIQFLAFSGMRVFSEAQWISWEDVDWQRKEIIVRGNPGTGTKNSEVRRIPIIPDMEALLTRMKGDGNPFGKILGVASCKKALTRACKELGIARITHHDLRHLFATRCIESGVDIPTVARWLGHKDGGALAMRTYGHLRNEHSQQMAQKVRF